MNDPTPSLGSNKLAYAYLLTPAGVAAKTSLTARFLKRKMAVYTRLRQEWLARQQTLAPLRSMLDAFGHVRFGELIKLYDDRHFELDLHCGNGCVLIKKENSVAAHGRKVPFSLSNARLGVRAGIPLRRP